MKPELGLESSNGLGKACSTGKIKPRATPCASGIGGELGRRALEHDAAMAHDVEAAGDLERDGELLLNQQDRRAAPGDLVEQRADLLDQLGRQALGRLVDDDEVGVAHQGAAHREHLLLAARQHAGRIVLARGEVGKQRKHVLELPAPEHAGALQPELEVLPHGQAGEHLAVLGHVADAGMGDLVGPQPRDRAALEADLADRRHQSHDRLAGGRAADAVAAEQAHDLALVDREVDALQDVALAVEGMQVADLEHHAATVPR